MTPPNYPLIRTDTGNSSRAQAIAAIARYLNTASTEKDSWALSGLTAAKLFTTGRLPANELEIIASGGSLIDAIGRCRMSTALRPNELLTEAQEATRLTSVSFDATWTRDRFLPDRPKAARAYRFALAHAQPFVLNVAHSTQNSVVQIPVLQPFDAYVVALAQMLEYPRNSPTRAVAAEKALALYQFVGAERISEQLRALSFLCSGGPALREANGVRRDDQDTFAYWHETFLHERSPHASPSATTKARTLFGRMRDWGAGRDFDQPDSVGR